MSLWTKAQQLPPEALQQIRNVYGEHFPIEVRHFLAPWIEEKLRTEIDPDNPQHEKYIHELISSFIQEVEAKANSIDGESDMFLTKMKLLETTNLFKQRYSYNPSGLYRMIRHCLLTEMRLVQQSESSSSNQLDSKNTFSFANPTYVELHHNIDTLRGQTQEIVDIIKRLDSEQESFSLKFYEFQKIKDQLQQMQNSIDRQSQEHIFLVNKLLQSKKALENLLQEKAKMLSNYQLHIVEKLKEEYLGVSALIHRMIDTELLSWKRNQQLAGNGYDFDIGHLDILQTWCESLAEITWANLTQTKETKRLSGLISQYIGESQSITSGLHDLGSKFTELLSSLVTNTFILEKQPPQVMKTNTRFSAKVRLLVGGKLNVHMNPPVVKVSIISEAQANYLLTEKTFKGEVSGDILNNTGTMEYEQTSKQLSITFRNMQLKKIKRAEKKGSESVVDEKFSLFFSSKFLIGGELEYHVWTLSLPVTVIVHGNQEPHAWATITWDNAFAEPGRKPFVVPEKVTWNKVAQALNLKFAAVTGKALSKENLKYLAEKLFRMQSDDYDSLQLSWSQFNKESLEGRNFTFWDWFYAIMKLTREHLKSLWVDGSIHGFVRKRRAEEMLSTCTSGTFLLRFSDSELGGITVAWVGGGGEQKEVIMVQPLTAKDFAIRSLADRLNDLSHLLYLYPDTPKEKAFGRYYTPFTDSQCTSSNGYVKPLVVMQLPGWGNRTATSSSTPLHGALHSYPNTPHSMFHPSSPGDTASVMSEPGISYGAQNEVDCSDLYMDNTVDFHNIDFNIP